MTDTFATYRLSPEKVKSGTRSIATRSANLANDIHRLAVAIMLNTLPMADKVEEGTPSGHQNAAQVLPFLQGLAAGMPRNKVIGWFAEHSNVRVTVSDGGKKWACKLLSPKDKEYRVLTTEQVETAIKNPYWTGMGQERDIDTLDADKLLANLIKRLSKAVDEGKVKDPVRAAAQLAGIRKLTSAASQEVAF